MLDVVWADCEDCLAAAAQVWRVSALSILAYRYPPQQKDYAGTGGSVCNWVKQDCPHFSTLVHTKI